MDNKNFICFFFPLEMPLTQQPDAMYRSDSNSLTVKIPLLDNQKRVNIDWI